MIQPRDAHIVQCATHQRVLQHAVFNAGSTELIAQFGDLLHGDAVEVYDYHALAVLQLFADFGHDDLLRFKVLAHFLFHLPSGHG